MDLGYTRGRRVDPAAAAINNNAPTTAFSNSNSTGSLNTKNSYNYSDDNVHDDDDDDDDDEDDDDITIAKKNNDELPPPVDLTHHLSKVATRRTPSVIKAMYKYFLIPGVKNLSAGLPPPEFFPFDTLEGIVSNPDRLKKSGTLPWTNIASEKAIQQPSPLISSLFNLLPRPTSPPPSHSPTTHLAVPKYPPGPPPANPFAPSPLPSLSSALQYSTAIGYAPLRTFILNFALHHLHQNSIPYANPEIILSCGNTDGINKVFETLLQDGDTFLVEKYTYLPAVSAGTPRGARAVPVEIDGGGLVVEGEGGLRWVLENWTKTALGRRGGWRKPRVLYTIPTGQNPTGTVTSIERKKEVYKVCEEHDVIIVEDDPYWHLQFPDHSSSSSSSSNFSYSFLRSLTPSYITIDTSGRVLRLDTFSKTIAPGCRLGWITGQPVLIERLLRATEASTAAPSGFVQSLLAELLSERYWGLDGFVGYVEGLRDRYREKLEAMLKVLDKGREILLVQDTTPNPDSDSEYEDDDIVLVNSSNPTNDDEDLLLITSLPLLSFTPPKGGMFIWVQIHLHNHPLSPALSASYLSNKLFNFLVLPEYGFKVLVGPGKMFFAPSLAPQSHPGSATTFDYINNNGTDIGDDDPAHGFTRLSFSFLSTEECVTSTEAFLDGIKAFWGLSRKKVDSIRDLVDVSSNSSPGDLEMHMISSGPWGY